MNARAQSAAVIGAGSLNVGLLPAQAGAGSKRQEQTVSALLSGPGNTLTAALG